ncbi:MAG: hypothetical protein A3G93_16025 [Nitrospinae bacterium RIFCSPLOWO2_12_FULL_45_22]|nr:MAG: hypothetical protein A3G93_16025 [Nitrospinae bacterium RIFCSPLOWO2_12_FULL_45_22]
MIILSQEEENELRQIALSYQLILEINESLPNGTLAKLFIDMSNNGYRYMEMRRFIDPMQFYRRYTQVIREEDIFRFLLYHEIGHKLYDDCPIRFYLEHGQKGDFGWQWLRRFLENEKKADLFAVEKLFNKLLAEDIWTENFLKGLNQLVKNTRN